MLYVVSGFVRSGTSMMMKSLMAGGLGCFYRDQDPRLGEIYEMEHEDFLDYRFPVPYDETEAAGMVCGWREGVSNRRDGHCGGGLPRCGHGIHAADYRYARCGRDSGYAGCRLGGVRATGLIVGGCVVVACCRLAV